MIAGLYLTRRRAAISAHRIAVIALFIAKHEAVAARCRARPSGGRAIGFGSTKRRATVAEIVVVRQWIATFGTFDFAVAAHGLMALGRAADPTRIHGTIRIAGLCDIGNRHPGIALLGGRHQNAVATDGYTGCAGKRTLIA